MSRSSRPRPPQSLPAPLVMKDIYDYMVGELSPLKEDLFAFWERLSTAEVSYRRILIGRMIPALMDEHRSLVRRWIKARAKTIRMEEFISPDDPQGQQKVAELLGNRGLLESMRESADYASSVMRDITDTLRGLRAEEDFRRSGIFSLVAIVIAAGAVLISVFLP